jgi:hypothetical protein
MTHHRHPLPFDKVDLKDVAKILRDVYPQYSLCECARMAAEVVPEEGCVCSLCGPGMFPACVRRKPATSGA